MLEELVKQNENVHEMLTQLTLEVVKKKGDEARTLEEDSIFHLLKFDGSQDPDAYLESERKLERLFEHRAWLIITCTLMPCSNCLNLLLSGLTICRCDERQKERRR